MSQNMPNINSSTIKVDHGYQPIFISTDIENDPILNFIGRGKSRSQLGKAVKLGLFNDLEPPGKPGLAVRMFFPELNQGSAGNDAHEESISQNEIYGKGPSTVKE